MSMVASNRMKTGNSSLLQEPLRRPRVARGLNCPTMAASGMSSPEGMPHSGGMKFTLVAVLTAPLGRLNVVVMLAAVGLLINVARHATVTRGAFSFLSFEGGVGRLGGR